MAIGMAFDTRNSILKEGAQWVQGGAVAEAAKAYYPYVNPQISANSYSVGVVGLI